MSFMASGFFKLPIRCFEKWDKNLVKLNFSYRKCTLKIFVRPCIFNFKTSGFVKPVETERFTVRLYEPLCNQKPSN